MFRKPKRKAKASLRLKPNNDDEDEVDDDKISNNFGSNNGDSNDDSNDDEERREALEEARKRSKASKKGPNNNNNITSNASKNNTTILHQFETTNSGPSAAEMATRVAEYHPDENQKKKAYDTTNKLLAGPIRAATNIRTTCRFDYQPDICKDYKDTGFCGFGDTCIYLHDRGDTLSGWQLEKQWEEQQKQKQSQQEQQIQDFMDGKSSNDNNNNKDSSNGADGLPFACFICRNPFTNPVVTNCLHYFCESCIMKQVQTESSNCPICKKDTNGVFHEPIKLLAKKRRVVGRKATWQEFYDKLSGNSGD